MSLIANVADGDHCVVSNLSLQGKFVMVGIRQHVLIAVGPIVRKGLYLRPGECRVRVGGRDVSGRKWKRKALADRRTVITVQIRRLKHRWIGAAIVQAVGGVPDLQKLGEVFYGGVVDTECHPNTAATRRAE